MANLDRCLVVTCWGETIEPQSERTSQVVVERLDGLLPQSVLLNRSPYHRQLNLA